MLNKLVILVRSDAVRAFLKRTMIACVFDLFDIVFSDTQTVNALSIRTMIAVTLLNFLFRERLLLLRWTLLQFRGRRGIYHIHITVL